MALRRIQHRQEQRRKVLVSVVLAALMVMSGFGVYLSNQQSRAPVVKDFGVKFRVDPSGRFYEAELGGRDIPFYYLPSAVSSLRLADKSLLGDADAVVVSFDPDVSPRNLQFLDVVRFDIAQYFQKPVIQAVGMPSSFYSLPVIGCVNASASVPVIFFNVSEKPRVRVDGYCVVASANMTGFLELRDALLYDQYGVFDR